MLRNGRGGGEAFRRRNGVSALLREARADGAAEQLASAAVLLSEVQGDPSAAARRGGCAADARTDRRARSRVGRRCRRAVDARPSGPSVACPPIRPVNRLAWTALVILFGRLLI